MIGLLTARLATLEEANAAQQADLKKWVEMLPRVLLIEAEYQLAMRAAQSQWLRGLLTELVEGTISGIDSWRRMRETGEVAPEFEELEEMGEKGVGRDAARRGTRSTRPADMTRPRSTVLQHHEPGSQPHH